MADRHFSIDHVVEREFWIRHWHTGHIFRFTRTADGQNLEEGHRIINANSEVDAEALVPEARAYAFRLIVPRLPLGQQNSTEVIEGTPRVVQLEGRMSSVSSGRGQASTAPFEADTTPSEPDPAVEREILQYAFDILQSIPNQYPAPIRVEERDGKVAIVHYKDAKVLAPEQDFIAWRNTVLDHVRELSSGDFRQGTNHGRVRDRLVALDSLLSGSVDEIKERQFRIGYEVERLGGLISAYRSSADDMPALNAAVLEDLDQLHLTLRIGVDKLERWAEFRRQAADDPQREGDADPTLVSDALEKGASQMEAQEKYFHPELPISFRFMAEALKDRTGATKTIVYGAVKSLENVIVFLAQKALGIAKKSVEAVEDHISKAVAGILITGLGGVALQLSGALPKNWDWLKPLLDFLSKTGGGG